MPTTDVPTLASRGTMLEEVDRLGLGPDPAGAWDDAWLVDGELTAPPRLGGLGGAGGLPPAGKRPDRPGPSGLDGAGRPTVKGRP
jgi:hypothetical protein